LGIGLLAIVSLFLTRFASAHTPGISTVDLEVGEGGHVEGVFSFASTEAFGGLVLDRDRDGVVSPEEVTAATDDLRAFLLDGVEVAADRTRCKASFRQASLTELDGLVLEASYDCPSEADEIEATLFYLSALGERHREVVRIAAPGATAEGLLRPDHRELTLRLPARPRPPRSALARRWSAVAAMVVVAALLLLALRFGGNARRG
jgi:hypothetical protein